MATLIIHAPQNKAEQDGKRSFADTIKRGIGDGYAISKKQHAQLGQGDKVIVLDKVGKRRAEGVLVRLDEHGKTETGMKRYDVHIEKLREVPYKPEDLGRGGVSVVE